MGFYVKKSSLENFAYMCATIKKTHNSSSIHMEDFH
jgi:hypothetical protein